MTGAFRIAQRNALVYRRGWRGSLFGSFLQPTLFLLAMGIGVGGLVDSGGPVIPGGGGFLAFLAPGLLAAACMQTATFESAYPILGKLYWHRTYDAMIATPIRITDLVLGELAWLTARLSMVAVAFALVIAAFGAGRAPLAILAVPAAVLTGLAFGAPLMAYAATRTSGNDFNVVFRFIITPLFLFSGVFFPLALLPEGLRLVAWATPLFHGVELTRGIMLGTLDVPGALPHLAYLTAMVAAGTLTAIRTFTRRIRT